MGKLAFFAGSLLAIGALSACGGGTTGTGTSSGTGTTGSPGAVAAPVSSVPPGVYQNDFKLGLTSATPGATICFSLDGSTPACAAGVCQGSAATYSSQTQIPIDGTVTSTAPGASFGSVTVSALACRAGQTDGAGSPGVYTLQVAEPALSNPSTAAPIPYGTATITPTVSSATEGANALYTTAAGTPPTCTSGTPLAALPAQLSFAASSGKAEFLVIGCRAGYQPSTVLDATYAFALNTPVITPASSSVTYDSDVQGQVDDSANAGSGDSLCLSFGAIPDCACDAGLAGMAGGISSFDIVSTDGGVRALACPPNGSPLSASAIASSGNYTLQLDPIHFSPTPGTLQPYSAPLTIIISQSGAGRPYDFICSSSNGTVPDCNCDTVANPTWIKIEGVTATVTVPSPGPSTVQAVGCTDPLSVVTFLPSDIPAASATYPLAPPMTAPTIEPADGMIAADPQPVTFTNNDTSSAYFCYTLDDTAPPIVPSCPPAGSSSCTAATTGSGLTSTDGPEVSASGTTVRAVACDIENVKPPSVEATPVTFTN